MSILELFSKRQKLIRGEVTDVYSYTKVPKPLRVQIVHIFIAAIGIKNEILPSGLVDQVYFMLNSGLAKEYGLFTLGKQYDTPQQAVLNFLLNEENHERFIDAVEYTLKIIDFRIRDNYEYKNRITIKQSPDDAIQEINQRFKENAFGYTYQNGQIIRIDSEFIHIEAIKPVLNLLRICP